MQSRYTHKDGTPFTKEEFIQKLKKDKEFNDEFGNKGIDQISDLIKQLKENPDSRRILLSAWNPSDLPKQVLPPCHYGFQVYTRELSIKERFDLWEKLPNRDVMDFPIGELTEEQYHEVLNDLGVKKRAISLM